MNLGNKKERKKTKCFYLQKKVGQAETLSLLSNVLPPLQGGAARSFHSEGTGREGGRQFLPGLCFQQHIFLLLCISPSYFKKLNNPSFYHMAILEAWYIVMTQNQSNESNTGYRFWTFYWQLYHALKLFAKLPHLQRKTNCPIRMS